MIGRESVDLSDSKAHEESLEAALGDWVAARPAARAVEECLARKVPAGRVQGVDDVAGNPFSWEREILLEREHPASGTIKVLGSAFKSNRSPGVVATTAPVLGEHTRAVLSDLLGYSDDRIGKLAANDVIALPDEDSPS